MKSKAYKFNDLASAILKDRAKEVALILRACSYSHNLEMIKQGRYSLFRNAVKTGKAQIVLLLLAALTIEDRRLMIHDDEFGALCDALIESNNVMITTLFRVADYANRQMMRKFMKLGLLCRAIEIGDIPEVNRIFDEITPEVKQILIRARNFTVFATAVRNGRVQIVRLLLREVEPGQKQKMIHSDDFLAMKWAVENGHTKTVELLLNEIEQDDCQKRIEIIQCTTPKANIKTVALVLAHVNQGLPQLMPHIRKYASAGDLIKRVHAYKELLGKGVKTNFAEIFAQKAIMSLMCKKSENLFMPFSVKLLTQVYSFLDIPEFPQIFWPNRAEALSLKFNHGLKIKDEEPRQTANNL